MDGAYAVATLPSGEAVWAAWWSALPTRQTFVGPDAHGRAPDEHAARLAAFRACGRARGVRSRVELPSAFAAAAARWVEGKPAWKGERRKAAVDLPVADDRLPADALARLGLEPPYTLARARAAYRKQSLLLHPDRGGDPRAFVALTEAWKRVKERLGG
jgi:hypothetical protein